MKECNWKVKVTFFNTKLLQSEKLLSVGQVLLFEDADLKSTIALEELVRCRELILQLLHSLVLLIK